MKKKAFFIFTSIGLASISLASTQSLFVEYETKETKDKEILGFSSNKVGATHWSTDFALWGHFEILEEKNSNIETEQNGHQYGEIAGEYSISKIRISPSYSWGEDSRFGPNEAYGMQVRYTDFKLFHPYLGRVSEFYNGSTASSYYHYSRLGAHYFPGIGGLVLNMYLQTIDLQLNQEIEDKKGSGFLISLNYFQEKSSLGFSYQRNCVANSYACEGEQKDLYSEVSMAGEYTFHKNWALRITLGLIDQGAQFKNSSQKNVDYQSYYNRLLIRYIF